MGWIIHTYSYYHLWQVETLQAKKGTFTAPFVTPQNAIRIEFCSILQCYGQPVPLDRSTLQSVVVPHCALPTPWTRCSRVKGLVEIPWRNMEKQWKTHHKVPSHFWTIPAAYESKLLLSFLSSTSSNSTPKKKSTAVLSLKSTISQHSNNHPTISYQESIHRHQVTILGCVPSSLEALQPSEVPTIRWIFTWGEGMPAALAQRWRSGDGVRLVELLISNLVKNKEGVRILHFYVRLLWKEVAENAVTMKDYQHELNGHKLLKVEPEWAGVFLSCFCWWPKITQRNTHAG